MLNGLNHLTLTVTQLEPTVAGITAQEVKVWKDNKSEGASDYFLDPDDR